MHVLFYGYSILVTLYYKHTRRKTKNESDRWLVKEVESVSITKNTSFKTCYDECSRLDFAVDLIEYTVDVFVVSRLIIGSVDHTIFMLPFKKMHVLGSRYVS